MICSPDEIVDDTGEVPEAVEIKCLDSWKQSKLTMKTPDYSLIISTSVNENSQKLISVFIQMYSRIQI